MSIVSPSATSLDTTSEDSFEPSLLGLLLTLAALAALRTLVAEFAVLLSLPLADTTGSLVLLEALAPLSLA